MPGTKAKATEPQMNTDTLVAIVGLEYLGTDGQVHRLEAGDTVGADQVQAKARAWMAAAGFLVLAREAKP